MPFYNSYKSILHEKKDNVSPEDLWKIDHYHYLGEEPLDEFALLVGKEKENAHVLDVGSGLCGPSRYLCKKYNMTVTGVEIQNDYAKAARMINSQFDMDDKINVINQDILTLKFRQKYDSLVSLLVFLHISDKTRLFSKLSDAVKNGGVFLIEDFFIKKDLTDDEKRLLEKVVGCPCESLLNKDQYTQVLEKSGFEKVEFIDMSDKWAKFCGERFNNFKKNRSSFQKIHGRKIYKSMEWFYKVTHDLFANGNLGGVRVTGVRKDE